MIVNMKNKKKTVYVPMAADVLHHGHINIISKARELGEVVVGLYDDTLIANYKRVPMMSLEKRKLVVENIKGVDRIVVQSVNTFDAVLKDLKPDYVVHGDDWKTSPQKKMREHIIKIISEWGGELVEPKYTKGISSTALIEDSKKNGVTTDQRRRLLRRLLSIKPLVRILEAHNGLTGLIVEKAKVDNMQFDGMWLSSLTHSASKGKPDIQYVDVTTVSQTLNEIFDVTTKPMIVDADNGGLTEHFKFMVRSLERFGVSAVIIEDKIGRKRNSLFGTDKEQTQDSIDNFCEKIRSGKNAQVTDDFMIIARIESLILKNGVDDALERAHAYVNSGADGVMIHSKEKDPEEIISFVKKFRSSDTDTPIIVVPSTYNSVTEDELESLGVNVVIYANHMLRSAYPAMVATAEKILKHGRSYEANDLCLPIKEILTLIPGTD
jgi:phosphoenolpyruvate mutase